MQTSDTIEEQDLLRRVREHDEVAFVMLLDAYMPIIRQETARMRHVAADEDDLAQEAALGLLSAAKAYRPDGGATFATFARVCIRRRIINVVRSLPYEEIPHQYPMDVCDRDDEAVVISPDQVVQEKDDKDALLKTLKDVLSSLEYRVLMLHIASYSYKEIAQILHLQPKAVDNAVQRIRRKLKNVL